MRIKRNNRFLGVNEFTIIRRDNRYCSIKFRDCELVITYGFQLTFKSNLSNCISIITRLLVSLGYKSSNLLVSNLTYNPCYIHIKGTSSDEIT